MSDPVFIQPEAIVEPGAVVGVSTNIWAFVHFLPGAKIGENCNICDGVFIENNVVVGNRVTIKSGVQLWDGIFLEDDVFVGPNATFTNDPFPRSKQHLDSYKQTIIQKGASIGANATILPGLNIGAHAMVGAGAVVTRDVPPNAIVTGNPARIRGYVSLTDKKVIKTVNQIKELVDLSVTKAKLIRLPCIIDLRGGLTFGEYDKHLPFSPKRFFVIFDVPTKDVREEHAHKEQHQFLVCLKGSCSVVLDDGYHRDEIVLNHPTIGLYVPPMIWGIQYKYTMDAVLLVLASDIYESDDYIREYEVFIDGLKEKNG